MKTAYQQILADLEALREAREARHRRWMEILHGAPFPQFDGPADRASGNSTDPASDENS